MPPDAEFLRQSVREFFDEALFDFSTERRLVTWDGFDADLSRRVGARGLIGMTSPKFCCGGSGAPWNDVGVGEMFAAGAPAEADRFSDRQDGPLAALGQYVFRRAVTSLCIRGEPTATAVEVLK
uniref:Acyl-CoA dehydrogenase n=1 Tax=Aromatoleum buckelii TaxID=200254 RepID=A0ABX1N376_9RHOO